MESGVLGKLHFLRLAISEKGPISQTCGVVQPNALIIPMLNENPLETVGLVNPLFLQGPAVFPLW